MDDVRDRTVSKVEVSNQKVGVKGKGKTKDVGVGLLFFGCIMI